MHVELLIIDPQVDFCDPQKGTLYVAGAERDVARLARMIHRIAPKLADIHVTLDSHHLVDIAHPIFWRDGHGQPPAPFTLVSADECAERTLDTRPARPAPARAGLCAGARAQRAVCPVHLAAALPDWQPRACGHAGAVCSAK